MGFACLIEIKQDSNFVRIMHMDVCHHAHLSMLSVIQMGSHWLDVMLEPADMLVLIGLCRAAALLGHKGSLACSAHYWVGQQPADRQEPLLCSQLTDTISVVFINSKASISIDEVFLVPSCCLNSSGLHGATERG